MPWGMSWRLREEEKERQRGKERRRTRDREIISVESSSHRRENGTMGESSEKWPPRTKNLAKIEGTEFFFWIRLALENQCPRMTRNRKINDCALPYAWLLAISAWYRLTLQASLSLSLSLLLTKVTHAQYRKSFRASYNKVHVLCGDSYCFYILVIDEAGCISVLKNTYVVTGVLELFWKNEFPVTIVEKLSTEFSLVSPGLYKLFWLA